MTLGGLEGVGGIEGLERYFWTPDFRKLVS